MDKSLIWFAVINVYAASKKAATKWNAAESALKEMDVVYHGSRTGKAGNATELTFDACVAGYRRFMAVGGDGTVHDVLNGIGAFIDWSTANGRNVSFSEFTMSVIPLGSGNDWIKSLNIPNNIYKAVEAIAADTISCQDVVRVCTLDPALLPEESMTSVSYMVNVGGVGLDAKVCEKVNAAKRRGKRGKILYISSLLQALKERIPSRMKVLADGKVVFEGQYLSIAFGVGKFSGGGMRQTPEAVLDDGLLDVTVIPDVALHRIAREVFRLFSGTFLKIPELVPFKSRSVVVIPEGGAPQPVEVDGEVVGQAPVRLDVLDSQINVIVTA